MLMGQKTLQQFVSWIDVDCALHTYYYYYLFGSAFKFHSN